MNNCNHNWKLIQRKIVSDEDSIIGFIFNTLTLSDEQKTLVKTYQCVNCKEIKKVKVEL